MIDIVEIVDLLTKGASLVREHVPTQYLPAPGWLTAGLIVTGLVLALWGARLMRAVFVLTMVVAGAWIGIRLAETWQEDQLIGLVLGAGLTGLVGHLMYRWWVAVSAGLCAALLVMMVGGQRVWLTEIEAFVAQRQPLVAQDYNNALAAASLTEATPSAQPHLKEIGAHFWENRRNLVIRSGLLCGLAFVLGFGMGLAVPKLTIVVGTSLIGVIAVIMGVGIWVTVYQPEWWAFVDTHLLWFVMATGLILLMSIMTQVAHRRPAGTLVATPTPATA